MNVKTLFIIYIISTLNLIKCLSPKLEELMIYVENIPPAEETLIFAQIFFRHGQRVASEYSTYKNDPHKYSSFWPYNMGDLTKTGMLQSFKIGLELRQRYGKFLGSTYNSHIIGSLSSTRSRCKESLQGVLAGMFPPNKDERFLDDFQWRPIAYNILPMEKDDLFTIFDCDNYWHIASKITNQTILDLCEYLTVHTGQSIDNTATLYGIFDAIYVQMNLGKKQPDWVEKIYPEPLTSASHNVFDDFIEHRLEHGASGVFKHITKMFFDKLNGTLSPPRRRMMLYAGHELTILYALGGIKAFNGKLPKLASYLCFELHYINQTYGIKIYWQNYEKMAPVPVDVLGYGEFCPLDKFMEGVKWLVESTIGRCEF